MSSKASWPTNHFPSKPGSHSEVYTSEVEKKKNYKILKYYAGIMTHNCNSITHATQAKGKLCYKLKASLDYKIG